MRILAVGPHGLDGREVFVSSSLGTLISANMGG
jgi:hypothetical protein